MAHTRKTKLPTECSRCGRTDDFKELDYAADPDLKDGEPVCRDCYHECCEFECCWCCNLDEVQHQHELLCVFDSGHGVPVGIYRIKHGPYYGGSLIGRQGIFPSAVEWLCGIPKDLDIRGQDYPCGHLCRECQKRITEGTALVDGAGI